MICNAMGHDIQRASLRIPLRNLRGWDGKVAFGDGRKVIKLDIHGQKGASLAVTPLPAGMVDVNRAVNGGILNRKRYQHHTCGSADE